MTWHSVLSCYSHLLILLVLLILCINKVHVLDKMIYALLPVKVLVLLRVLMITKRIDNRIHYIEILKSWQILLTDSISNLHNSSHISVEMLLDWIRNLEPLLTNNLLLERINHLIYLWMLLQQLVLLILREFVLNLIWRLERGHNILLLINLTLLKHIVVLDLVLSLEWCIDILGILKSINSEIAETSMNQIRSII